MAKQQQLAFLCGWQQRTGRESGLLQLPFPVARLVLDFVFRRGELWCWGSNNRGQLAREDQSDVAPGLVSLPCSVLLVAAGGNHTVAILEDGRLYAWGSNADMQLGITTAEQCIARVPHLVTELPVGVDPVGAACGICHTVVLLANGTVWGWGDNSRGQLGRNRQDEHLAPGQVEITEHVKSIRCGGYHSAALAESGTLLMWGANEHGQLGLGDEANRSQPQEVSALPREPPVKMVSCGYQNSVALLATGDIFAWGGIKEVQTPQRVDFSNVKHPLASLACGFRQTLAVTESGELYSWSSDYNGCAGLLGRECASATVGYTPTRVPLQTRIELANGGYEHTIAVSEGGLVLMCGDTNYGQAGVGGNGTQHTLTQVEGLPTGRRATSLACGNYHSAIVLSL
eukprot:TRINITY_DN5170_c0_g1_i2.p1 TRINITY_DN5170_c0_g1~~TRINITY_DN5170_c0_g1_i2.p1  ORF type:complete len:400 (-),score=49.66 TRINITY_DN5170_c0_g1_i2:62-1261(-)